MKPKYPITRKELYLDKITGGDGDMPSPVTREEMYLSKIAGESFNVPTPITRYEQFLKAIADGTEPPTPITRLEQYLAKAADMAIEVSAPITREEMYWSFYTPHVVSIKTAEGTTIQILDALEKPTENLIVYGKSEVVDGQFNDVGTAKVVHGKNLLNPKTMKNNKGLIWSSGKEYDVSNAVASDYIATEKGVSYYSSFGMQILMYDAQKNYLGVWQSASELSKSGNVKNGFTVPQNYDVAFFRVAFRPADNRGADMTKANIQLELGTSATEYEPYWEKTVYEVEVKSTGKNLLDMSAVFLTKSFVVDNGFFQSSPNYNIVKINITNNAAYILSNLPPQARSAGIGFYDKSDNFVEYLPYSGKSFLTLDSPTNAVYALVSIRNTATEMQLELGSEATEYEPYKESTTTLQLDQPLRGIPVTDSSLATYTDESGQMWCADEVGNGKLIQRISEEHTQIVAPTTTEIEQPKLQLHSGENNISNDQSAYMSVTYQSSSKPVKLLTSDGQPVYDKNGYQIYLNGE